MSDEAFAVVFDLDDTLYPESSFVESGFEAVSEFLSDRTSWSCEELNDLLLTPHEAGVRGDNFDQLLAETGIDVDVDVLVDHYRTHEPAIELSEDAGWCLDKLAGRTSGLITDGRETKQRQKIRALGLEDRFDVVYISGVFGPDCWKPAPDMFEAFCSETEHGPDRTVYIGDNPAKDFVAPNELGMRSIWVDRGWGEYADETPTTVKAEPTTRVDDLYEVPHVIEQWETDT